jgi:regulatory protein
VKAPVARDLRERALRLLARREHSRAQLEQKLGRDLPADGAEDAPPHMALSALLDELEQRGLLSDERFAKARTASRGQRLGKARLTHELRTQGVDDAIIASALAELEETGDELSRARAVWQRKFGALPESREAWAKQARFLHSRGFGGDTIRQVLKGDAADLSNAREDDLY